MQKGNRDPMNEWGVAVATFCLRRGITKKQLAAEANIPYDTLLQVSKGRRAGHTARQAVQAVMDQYEAIENSKSVSVLGRKE